MVINPTLQMILLALMPVSLIGAAFGAEGPAAPAKTVDYKRADTNFYNKGDVLKADLDAVILPPSAFAQNGDTYTFTPKKKAPKTLYVEAAGDWIEPITPPDMPATLDIAPDAMQVREPQGDVQVALPSAPANFAPVTDGMALPNGAVIKTGTNATAAILFGGVDSTRLMPDSEAAVQQSVTPQARSVEVDLTAGGVFVKVGTQLDVKGELQVRTSSGNVIAQGGDFAALTDMGRTDVWVSLGTVELLQTDGKKFGTAIGEGTGPLKLIRFPAIADPAKTLLADAESLTAIMNFIPVANQKLAALHAKQAKGVPLSANEQAYLNRIKQVPALIKLALVEPPPPPAPVPAPAPIPPPAPAVAAVPPPPEPETIILHPNGTIKFQRATLGLAEFQKQLNALIAAKPDQSIIIKASPLVPYAKFKELLDACKDAHVREIAVAPPSPQPPATAEATPSPAPPANPDVTTVPGNGAAPLEPLTVLVHGDGTVGFRGAKMDLAGFQAKLKAMVKATPDRDLVIKADPNVSYDRIKAVLDRCADAQVHHVTAPEPSAVTAETPPAPAPPVAEAPPTPAPVNDKPVPAEIDLASDGSLKLDGTPLTEDELKAKLDDLAATHPKNPLVMMKQPHVTKEQWQHYVTLCHTLGLKLLVKDAKAQAAPPISASPPAVAAAIPPPAPPVVNTAAIPATIDLAADGSLKFNGAAVTEDDLKARLTDLAATHPKNPLVMMKQPHVTTDQWQHYVALCHAQGLKLLVRDAKPDATATAAEAPPAARPAAAEGSPILPASGAPAPHLSASPAPSPSPDEAVPVEIELTPDGQISFLGEVVSDDELKTRLDNVAKSNAREPVLIVKDEKVAHDQLQHVVDLCHAAKLKVKVKTVKSSDTGALKPRANGPSGIASPAPSAAAAPAELPAPHLSASPAPEKLLPVEIGMTTDGVLTFEGGKVTGDELKGKLGTIAQANPSQTIVIVKKGDIPRDSVNAIIVLCHQANLKVTVKSVKSFTPPVPPDSSAAQDGPALSERARRAMETFNVPSDDSSDSTSSPSPMPSP